MVAESSPLEQIPSEIADAATSPAEYEIATYPADFTLQVLHSKWRQGEIVVPSFQRQFVWTQTQASRLIESFMLGLPVPSIFLYTDRKTEKFLVIDGQQRLKSVFYFFEGFFGDEIRGRRPVFRLTGLNSSSRWSGRSFQDLKTTDEPSAIRLQNSVLRSFVVKQLNPKDDTGVYHVFERLNTGGTLLKGQEIRNCVYDGSFNALLKDLNLNPLWRSVFGKRAPDSRMRDVELILRFLALHEAASDYFKPMKDFLSHFMSENRAIDAQRLAAIRFIFERTVSNLNAALGPKPFHLHRGINTAVFDAVTVALADARPHQLSAARESFAKLVRSPEFMQLTSTATTDVEAVKSRLAIARGALLR